MKRLTTNMAFISRWTFHSGLKLHQKDDVAQAIQTFMQIRRYLERAGASRHLVVCFLLATLHFRNLHNRFILNERLLICVIFENGGSLAKSTRLAPAGFRTTICGSNICSRACVMCCRRGLMLCILVNRCKMGLRQRTHEHHRNALLSSGFDALYFGKHLQDGFTKTHA
jgi:hypothetical protein